MRKDRWTAAEDALLVEAQRRLDNRWRFITAVLHPCLHRVYTKGRSLLVEVQRRLDNR